MEHALPRLLKQIEPIITNFYFIWKNYAYIMQLLYYKCKQIYNNVGEPKIGDQDMFLPKNS